MTNFAQALRRIEELKRESLFASDTRLSIIDDEIKQLTVKHADSILQLAKVAGDFREAFDGDSSAWALNEALAGDAMDTYDKLMSPQGDIGKEE